MEGWEEFVNKLPADKEAKEAIETKVQESYYINGKLLVEMANKNEVQAGYNKSKAHSMKSSR